jgi:hypothetical protein
MKTTIVSISPGVTPCSSAPCRPHTPWFEGWMDNAFVAVVPTRPCPLFGRPVHRRDGSHRLRPGTSPHALRIPPRGGHPALIGVARGQRDTFAFGYSALHPSASGTPTRLNTSLPSAHYGPIRHPLAVHPLPLAGYRAHWLRRFRGGARRASPVARRVLVTVLPLSPRRSVPPPQPDTTGHAAFAPQP